MIVFSSIYNNLLGHSNGRYSEKYFYHKVNLTILIGFMRILRVVIIICITFYLQSCSILGNKNDSGVYVKSKSIKFRSQIPLWNLKPNIENADLVLEKEKSNSLIIINSNCRKNNLSSLQSLKASILAGIENQNILEEKNITLHERDALETTFNGSLDGVNRMMTLTIFQRDFCVYDMILIAKTQKNHSSDFADYQKIIQEIFEF